MFHCVAAKVLGCLAVGDPTVLEPGMVVTIEPGFATEFGILHVEQNVAVTEDGPDVLSTAPWNFAERDAASRQPPPAN